MCFEDVLASLAVGQMPATMRGEGTIVLGELGEGGEAGCGGLGIGAVRLREGLWHGFLACVASMHDWLIKSHCVPGIVGDHRIVANIQIQVEAICNFG